MYAPPGNQLMSKSFIELINRLMRQVPGAVWLAVGGLLVVAFWLHQHDARIRQQVGLQQLRSETSAEVAALRKQAAQDVEQANVENAKAIRELEQRRQQAEQQNRQLAAQLDRLRKQAQVQAGEVATLPISEIVTRVAAQLGLKVEDIANGSHGSGVGAVGSSADMAKGAASAPPQATPHPVPPGGTTLSPRRGLGFALLADMARGGISAPPPERNTGILRSAQDDGRRAQDDNAALALTSSGARKVETALIGLNACRAESNVENQQLSNCRARAGADEAAIQRLNASVASLNQAIAAKDKILARQQTQYKAELRAARGTFLGRLARLTEHVAIGVGVGVAIGVAVK
jgi:hypothetical protein